MQTISKQHYRFAGHRAMYTLTMPQTAAVATHRKSFSASIHFLSYNEIYVNILRADECQLHAKYGQ